MLVFQKVLLKLERSLTTIREMCELARDKCGHILAPFTSKFLRLLSSLTPFCSIQFKNNVMGEGKINKSFS